MAKNNFKQGCKNFFASLKESFKKFFDSFYAPNNKGKINWVGVLTGLGGVFLCVVLIKFLFKFNIDWTKLQGVTLYTDSPIPFNEFDFGGLIRQPWNTISSLAYVFFGIYLLYLPWKRTERKTLMSDKLDATTSGGLRVVYALAMIVTGLGSTFMHMSMTFPGQICDVVGMYLIAVYLILYACRNIKGMNNMWFYIVYVIANAILLLTLVFIPDTRRYLFAVFIAIGLIMELVLNRGKMKFKYIVLGCVVMLFGYTFWQLDQMSEAYWYIDEFGNAVNRLDSLTAQLGYQTGLFFSKTGIFQGHTIWHVCGAIAGYFLFKHYISDNIEEPAAETAETEAVESEPAEAEAIAE